MKKRILLPLMVAWLIVSATQAQTFEADWSYTGEVLGNLSGGLKTGSHYLGYATLGMNICSDGLWKGGSLRVSMGNTHGGTPTESLIGDFQTVSNIEAGDHTFLRELWFQQDFGRFSLIGGLQDLNVHYATCSYSVDYINSSFGIFSTMSANFASPIFPITGLGLDLQWHISDQWNVQTAFFDGNVTDFDDNPHNLKWNLDLDKGYLSVSEVKFAPLMANRLEGFYTLGVYYHTELKTTGFYTTAAQSLWKSGERDLRAFFQASYTEKSKNNNYMYIGGGVNMTGVFSAEGRDLLGIGAAVAYFDKYPNETTLELFYKRHLGKYFFVQPDLQVVIHPAGTDVPVQDAIVGILRAGLEF